MNKNNNGTITPPTLLNAFQSAIGNPNLTGWSLVPVATNPSDSVNSQFRIPRSVQPWGGFLEVVFAVPPGTVTGRVFLQARLAAASAQAPFPPVLPYTIVASFQPVIQPSTVTNIYTVKFDTSIDRGTYGFVSFSRIQPTELIAPDNDYPLPIYLLDASLI